MTLRLLLRLARSLLVQSKNGKHFPTLLVFDHSRNWFKWRLFYFAFPFFCLWSGWAIQRDGNDRILRKRSSVRVILRSHSSVHGQVKLFKEMEMKTILCIFLVQMMLLLSGCSLALMSVAVIPATEYIARTEDMNSYIVVPVTTGLVMAHGGITYLLWAACWPCAVVYLGVSGVYTTIRINVE